MDILNIVTNAIVIAIDIVVIVMIIEERGK